MFPWFTEILLKETIFWSYFKINFNLLHHWFFSSSKLSLLIANIIVSDFISFIFCCDWGSMEVSFNLNSFIASLGFCNLIKKLLTAVCIVSSIVSWGIILITFSSFLSQFLGII